MFTAVTGGSGHIGGNLVRALLVRGRSVRCLVRNDRRALEGMDVEMVEGDIFEMDSLIKLFTGVRTVFHLAGRIQPPLKCGAAMIIPAVTTGTTTWKISSLS